MATKKVIEVEVKTGAAQKNVEDLNEGLQETASSAKNVGKESEAAGELASTAAGGAGAKFNAFKGILGTVINSFKTLKGAIIASGIGALALVVLSVGQAFTRSEEGQNKFAKIMRVIGSILDNVLDVLADFGEEVINVFTNPLDSIKRFSGFIKDQIVNRFVGMLELLPKIGKAIGLLFKGEFSEAGKVAADAVGKVVLGVDGVVEKTKQATQATRAFINELKEEAKIAAAIADRAAKADKIERGLIVERAEADRKRADLLEKAQRKDQFNLKQRIGFLKEASALEESITNQEIRAAKLRQKNAIEANALGKSNKEALDEEAEARAKVIQLETARLTKQKEVTGQIQGLLAEERAAYKATQDQRRTDFEDRKKAELDSIKDLHLQTLELKTEAEKAIEQIDVNAQTKRFENEKAANEKRLQLAVQLEDNKKQIAKNSFEAIANLASLFEGASERTARRAFKVQKAANIAQTLIDTYTGATAAFKSMSGIPVVGVPLGITAAAAAITSGLANVKRISSQAFGSTGGAAPSVPSFSGGGGGSIGGGGAPSRVPNFNVVGNAGINPLQGLSEPIKAFVVSSDITTAQGLERSKIETATL